ncbi:MAG: cell division protein SepF [Nitrosopumilaceae archaeon]|nr:cell division protein SepF [Nitrosopumilaceae archaeon]
MQKQENNTYLKAITIRDPSDVHSIKEDIKKNMILILRVTPLAQKDVDQLRKVVEELYSIAKTENAEIARLGEERIIVAPANIKIWKPEYDLK